MSTPEELRDRIIRDTESLYQMAKDTPPPPTDEWVPEPPSPTGIRAFQHPVEGTVWLRDKPDRETWRGLGSDTARAQMQRLSGLAENGGRHTYRDGRFRLLIKGHANALDEVAFQRCEFLSSKFKPDHYALFGGPFADVRFYGCNLVQEQGRESTVRVYDATRLLFDSCVIRKEPYEPYTKSPIRIHDSPSVRLTNCAIEGGSAIHVGAASEHLVNDRDPNPCGEFEMRDCTWSFHGLYLNQVGPCFRITGCHKVILRNLDVDGPPDLGPFMDAHLLMDGSAPEITLDNVTYNGTPVEMNDVRFI